MPSRPAITSLITDLYSAHRRSERHVLDTANEHLRAIAEKNKIEAAISILGGDLLSLQDEEDIEVGIAHKLVADGVRQQ